MASMDEAWYQMPVVEHVFNVPAQKAYTKGTKQYPAREAYTYSKVAPLCYKRDGTEIGRGWAAVGSVELGKLCVVKVKTTGTAHDLIRGMKDVTRLDTAQKIYTEATKLLAHFDPDQIRIGSNLPAAPSGSETETFDIGGDGWLESDGEWTLLRAGYTEEWYCEQAAGGSCETRDTGPGGCYHSGGTSRTNAYVEVDVDHDPPNSGPVCGAMVGTTAYNNGYRAGIGAAFDEDTLELGEGVTGNLTASQAVDVSTADFTLRVELNGTNLRMLQDGVEKIANQTVTSATGYGGVMSESGCSLYFKLLEYRAGALAAGTTSTTTTSSTTTTTTTSTTAPPAPGNPYYAYRQE
jgi:hypothetical protein